MKVFPLVKSVLVGLLVSAAMSVYAAEKAATATAETPHQVVDKVTTNLMLVVKNGKTALKENPDKYYAEVQAVLEEAVNFGFIARNVMGKYWQEANQDQQARFVETFKMSLVETYAKGMANFADLKIEVEPPTTPVPKAGKVSVIQKITAADSVNRVAYTMARREGGKWQLINVVLDGVNLGKTFQSQFAQSVKEHKGSVDAAIMGWFSQG